MLSLDGFRPTTTLILSFIWYPSFQSHLLSSRNFCTSFLVFVSEPNDESAANVDAAKTWRDNRGRFNEIAHQTVRKTLGL